MVNSIFFTPTSELSPPLGTQLWRVATKLNNNHNKFLSMEMTFNYQENVSTFNFPNGSYMTLFHLGTSVSSNGFGLFLNKDATSGNLKLGIRYSTGSGWIDLDFVDLTTLGYPNINSFQVLLTYDYAGTNKIVKFNVVSLLTQEQTQPSYTFETSTGPSINTSSLGQWGFGSVTDALDTNTNGYSNPTGTNYNSYIAQNVQVNFLRTWKRVIPENSNIDDYALFNPTFPSKSLYTLNRDFTDSNQSYVPAGTTDLDFQMYVPFDNTDLTTLSNNAINPSIPVTVTTQTTNFQTMPNFAINGTVIDSMLLNSIETNDISCIVEGTFILIQNEQGLEEFKKIQDLKINDLVKTYKDGYKRIVYIKHDKFRN